MHNDSIPPRSRIPLDPAAERFFQRLFLGMLIGVALYFISCDSNAHERARNVFGTFGPVSLKVCQERARLQGLPWKAKATYSLMVPACPRPMWVTTCLYSDH